MSALASAVDNKMEVQREVIRLCRQRKYRRLLATKHETAEPAPDEMPILPLFDDE
jgi:hypothetical protein